MNLEASLKQISLDFYFLIVLIIIIIIIIIIILLQIFLRSKSWKTGSLTFGFEVGVN